MARKRGNTGKRGKLKRGTKKMKKPTAPASRGRATSITNSKGRRKVVTKEGTFRLAGQSYMKRKPKTKKKKQKYSGLAGVRG